MLLDEPTNHLDLASQEILEQVLKQFPGTVLLVSHDRYLVEALATHIWRVAGNELRMYKGNYSEYQRQAALETESVKVASAANSARTSEDVQRERERSREERRQRRAAEKQAEQAAALEDRVQALETELTRLSAQLETASLAGDVGQIHELGLRYQEVEGELHRVMEAWAELA